MTWEDDTFDVDDENFESEKPDTGKGKFIGFLASTYSATLYGFSDDETDHVDNESEEELDWKA